LASLVREACVAALKSMSIDSTPMVTMSHFEEAFTKVQPSVSKSDHARYDELRRKLRRERGQINKASSSLSIEELGSERPSNPNKRVRDDGGGGGDEPEPMLN
jgi:ribosome biogenesis ATPase